MYVSLYNVFYGEASSSSEASTKQLMKKSMFQSQELVCVEYKRVESRRLKVTDKKP